MSNILINELRTEIDYLKKINDDMQIKKERIIETLEAGIKELEEAKERVKTLEQEKDYLNEDVETLKIEYDKTINDYNNLVTEYERIKEENSKFLVQINNMEKDLENQNLLQKRLIDHKNNYEKISLDYQNLKNFTENLEKENSNNLQQIKELKEEKNYLINNYEEKISSLNNDKNSLSSDYDNLNKQFKIIERKCNEALNNFKEKSFEHKGLEEKYASIDYNYQNEKKKNEILSNENKESISKIEAKLESSEKSAYNLSIRHDELRRELASKNDELSQLKQNFDEENLNKSKELTKLYNEFKKVSEKNKIYSEDVIEKDKIIINYKEKISHMENHIEMLSNLHKKFDELQIETENYLKERNHYRNLLKKLDEETNLLKENSNRKDQIIHEKNQFLADFQSESIELKNEFESILNKYNKMNYQLQNELKCNYEMECKLNRFVNRRDELENILVELDNEIIRVENIRKKHLKPIKSDDFSRKNSKSIPNSIVQDIRISIQSFLTSVKTMIKTVSRNRDICDSPVENFILNDDNITIDSLKSLEEWIKLICNELEV